MRFVRLLMVAVMVLAMFVFGASAATAAIPATLPSPATEVSGAQGPTTATISWSPPFSGGSGAVSGYTVSRDGVDSAGQVGSVSQVSATTRSFTWSELEPGNSYTLSVAAKNAAGTGPTVTVVVILTPTPRVQPTAPTSVTATQVTSTHVYLSWFTPSSLGKGTFQGYRVTRNGVSLSGDSTDTLTTTETAVVISNLKPGNTYSFTVAAYNVIIEGPPVTVSGITMTSKSTVAPSAPTSVSVSRTTSTTATISWSPPSNPGPGGVLGYWVSQSGTDPSGADRFAVRFPAGTRSFTTFALAPGDYTLEVTAYNAYGTGLGVSVDLTVTTGSTTVPSAPTTVSATQPNATRATISWSPPSVSGSSAITGYTVSRDGLDSTGLVDGYTTTVSSATRSFTMTRLLPGTTYHLAVSANNASGTGAAATVELLVTPTGPSAPTGLILTQSAAGTVTVSWLPPSFTNGSPVRRYQITRDGTDSAGTGAYTTTVPVATRSFTLTKLVTGSTYTITVQAINATGTGTAASAKITMLPGWVARTAPSLPGSNFARLSGVSCASPTACVVVGASVTAAGVSTPLAEVGGGATWTVKPVPLPSGRVSADLAAVSCTSPTACVAVGSSKTAAGVTSPLVSTWNGTGWTSRALPLPPGETDAGLSAISCTSSVACVAVGYTYNVKATSVVFLPFSEVWNGTTWTEHAAPSAKPSGARSNGFVAVSCSTPTFCVAVGQGSPLVSRWNGTTWSAQSLPAPQPVPVTVDGGSVINSVSCTSTTHCVAVGSDFVSLQGVPDQVFELPRVVVWDGTRWTNQPSPDPSRGRQVNLQSISCRSATNCTAVGALDLGNNRSVVENWNGTSWTVQLDAVPAVADSVFLTTSCTSATACTSVGRYRNAAGTFLPFIETR